MNAALPLDHTASPPALHLVGGDGVPLRVKDQIAHTPSGPVAVPFAKLIFTLSGWARVESPTGEVHLEAGSILTIPPGLECRGFPEGHARTVTFYFHPDYLADQIRWLSLRHPLVHCLHRALDGEPALDSLRLTPAAMRDLTPHLVSLSQSSAGALSDFARLSIASEVFDAVGRLSGQSTGTIPDTGRVPDREVATALTLLRADLSQRWRIDDLARAVALSPSQLSRLFRAQVGLSPAALLRQLRADRMAELLVTTSLPVSEAAAAVGWRDPAFASRSFKQRFGIAPSVYANSCGPRSAKRPIVTADTPLSDSPSTRSATIGGAR